MTRAEIEAIQIGDMIEVKGEAHTRIACVHEIPERGIDGKGWVYARIVTPPGSSQISVMIREHNPSFSKVY